MFLSRISFTQFASPWQHLIASLMYEVLNKHLTDISVHAVSVFMVFQWSVWIAYIPIVWIRYTAHTPQRVSSSVPPLHPARLMLLDINHHEFPPVRMYICWLFIWREVDLCSSWKDTKSLQHFFYFFIFLVEEQGINRPMWNCKFSALFLLLAFQMCTCWHEGSAMSPSQQKELKYPKTLF